MQMYRFIFSGLVGLLLFVSAAVPGVAGEIQVQNVKMVNYYRGDAGWRYFWSSWNSGLIRSDFGKIRKMGFNTVRVFVQPDAVGYPVLTADGRRKIAEVFAIAAENHLKVQLTLFDLWGNYSDIDQSRQWLDSVRNAISEPRQIAYIDLKNEVVPEDIRTLRWLKTMLGYTQSRFEGVPVTFSMVIGVSRPIDDRLALVIRSGLKPDLWDFHYYMTPENLPNEVRKIRSEIGGAPAYFGEIGASSYAVSTDSVNSDGCSVNEGKQAAYLNEAEKTLRALGLPFGGVWAYSDFSRTAIPKDLGVAKKRTEYCFGLFSTEGRMKPAGRVMQELLTGRGD
jgi:hypothetical protein